MVLDFSFDLTGMTLLALAFCNKKNLTGEYTFRGGMLSDAKSKTRARLASWCVLKTHCTNKLGWQLWLMNLATLPLLPASKQYSGPLSISSSTMYDGKDTSPTLFCWTQVTQTNELDAKSTYGNIKQKTYKLLDTSYMFWVTRDFFFEIYRDKLTKQNREYTLNVYRLTVVWFTYFGVQTN